MTQIVYVKVESFRETLISGRDEIYGAEGMDIALEEWRMIAQSIKNFCLKEPDVLFTSKMKDFVDTRLKEVKELLKFRSKADLYQSALSIGFPILIDVQHCMGFILGKFGETKISSSNFLQWLSDFQVNEEGFPTVAHWWHLTEEENDILLHAKQKLQSLYKHLVHCQHGKFPDLTVWAQSLYDVFGIDYNTWLNRKTQKVAVCLISSSGEYLAHVFLFLNRSIPYECEMMGIRSSIENMLQNQNQCSGGIKGIAEKLIAGVKTRCLSICNSKKRPQQKEAKLNCYIRVPEAVGPMPYILEKIGAFRVSSRVPATEIGIKNKIPLEEGEVTPKVHKGIRNAKYHHILEL